MSDNKKPTRTIYIHRSLTSIFGNKIENTSQRQAVVLDDKDEVLSTHTEYKAGLFGHYFRPKR